MMPRLACSLLVVLPMLGCAANPSDEGDAEDAADGSFAGKSDAFGASEGSPEALGVLRVANELSAFDLDDDVGLSYRAAKNITERRAGDDAQLGTADDQPFATLAELDAVPYIGENAFLAMLAYAEREGWIMGAPGSADPFAANPCAGIMITEATEDRPKGSLGFYQFAVRERTCNPGQGCTAWAPVALAQIGPQAESHFTGELRLTTSPYSAQVYELELATTAGAASSSCYKSRCSLRDNGASCETYYACTGAADLFPGRTTGRPAGPFGLVGKLTEECVTLRGSSYWIENPSNVRHERQAAFVLRD